MTFKGDLIAAKSLIDTPEKWFKGWYENSDGCLCALGAVTKATTGFAGEWLDNIHDDSRSRLLQRALIKQLPSYWRHKGVAAFNDSARRTHADIMALFDRAIEAAA